MSVESWSEVCPLTKEVDRIATLVAFRPSPVRWNLENARAGKSSVNILFWVLYLPYLVGKYHRIKQSPNGHPVIVFTQMRIFFKELFFSIDILKLKDVQKADKSYKRRREKKSSGARGKDKTFNENS